VFFAYNHRGRRCKIRQVSITIEKTWSTDVRYTSVDATHLFLCAFVVSLPTATTLKIKYEAKRKALQGGMQEFVDMLTRTEEDAVRHGTTVHNCDAD